MAAQPPDWPKVLSLAVHEFRTPLTVVAGYLRMLSTDRMGPLTDAQRRVIQEAERSCGRLSTLLTEVSDVAHFHQGRLSFFKNPVALAQVLSVELMPAGDRQLELVADTDSVANEQISGDAGRLRQSIASVAAAIGRETVDADRLHLLAARRENGSGPEVFVSIGSEPVARTILESREADLPPFDSTRGGNGLGLVVARQIIEDHGGRLYGAPGDRPRSGAGIALPLS